MNSNDRLGYRNSIRPVARNSQGKGGGGSSEPPLATGMNSWCQQDPCLTGLPVCRYKYIAMPRGKARTLTPILHKTIASIENLRIPKRF